MSNWTEKQIRPGDLTSPVVNVYSEAKTLEYFKRAEQAMTNAQARLLRYTRRGAAVLDGDYVDCSLMTGWNGAALDAVIRSCRKRGWLDDRGAITDAGRKQIEANS